MWPDVLIDFTRGSRKSHSRSGAQNGAEEPAAGSVDVDVDVEAGVGLQLVERFGQIGFTVLVGAGVGQAQGRHDEDRVLVDVLEHLLGRHRVLAVAIGISRISMSQYFANLCHTTCTAPHTMFGLSVGLPVGLSLGPPPPLGGHAAEHACLRRPDRRGADGLAIGRVPQVGEHVHASALDLRGLRVLVLVDHVLVDREVHQRVDLRLLPRLAERGEVLAGVAVEHHLVGHDLERVVGAISSLGKRYFGTAVERSCPANTESSSCSRIESRSCRVMGVMLPRAARERIALAG